MNSQKINGGLSSLIPAAAFIATFAAAIPAHAQTAACPSDNAGITLSPGFCATVFADKLGHARHLAVAPNGVVYVNTWSGRYYHNDTPPPGGFLIALQDTKGDGQADNVVRFGPTKADGNAGGTGIAVYKNYVYAETNDRIVRYALPTTASPRRRRRRRWSRACRSPAITRCIPSRSTGRAISTSTWDPRRTPARARTACRTCRATSRARNWKPAAAPGATTPTSWISISRRQSASSTGLRNGEGFSFDSAGRIFATQHGRDQLGGELAQASTSPMQGANEPAEELVQLRQWRRLRLAGMLFRLRPEEARPGAGIWRRRRQDSGRLRAEAGAGRRLPRPLGAERHADLRGQPVPIRLQGRRVHRVPRLLEPRAVAAGRIQRGVPAAGRRQGGRHRSSSSLTDSPGGQGAGSSSAPADRPRRRAGRRALHRGRSSAAGSGASPTRAGNKSSGIAAAAPTPPTAQTAARNASPPEGDHPKPARLCRSRPAARRTRSRWAIASSMARSPAEPAQAATASDGKGSSVGSDLTSGKWLWGDGSVAAITRTIDSGVPKAKEHSGAMPPMGGAQLSQADVAAVADYVWALGHQTTQ